MGINSVYSLSPAQIMFILIFLSLPLTTLCTGHCPPLPTVHCGQVWDSHDCSGGWNLTFSDGQSMAFDGFLFSSTWWFRNDIDRVGVRPGCNLTMWSGDDYTGDVRSWTESDRWLVLEDELDYASLHENINSLHCSCNIHSRHEGHTFSDV